ncbi:hypothetical protein QNO09_04780 [Streptomyces sp. 378]|uniref:hypothetical protein n=1 Tax=Streptomyces sp. 378 TaxID=3049412 RepID=UPI0024C32CE1|nr:hypothetical protein [Streptomyces sp. 378]MDK1342637.1 hypothetical protein [Streptomyces sp. 378]
MRSRTGSPGAARTGLGGIHADGGHRVTGPGPGTPLADRTRAGVGGTRAAGIPVASTPSSALRLHVPAPAPLIR